MGVNSRSYWWISCDGEGLDIYGCSAGDNIDDDDSAYGAECIAIAHGWIKTKEGLWLCPEHQICGKVTNKEI
jgi:hypothetical protein